MRKKVVINSLSTEKRVALLEDEKVVEILIDQPNDVPKAGDIYIGKVEKVLPGIQAAFVQIGHEKNGYLSRDQLLKNIDNDLKISECIHQGQTVVVQVSKEEQGDKGARLSQIVELSGRYIVYMPDGKYVAVSKKMNSEKREKWRSFGEEICTENEGMIIRTSCTNASEEDVIQELNMLRKLWVQSIEKAKSKNAPYKIFEELNAVDRMLRNLSNHDYIEEILIDDQHDYLRLKDLFQSQPNISDKLSLYKEKENIFSAHRIDQEITKAMLNQVWLNSGGFINIDKTEALTIIDVNTGKFTGKMNLKETTVKTNEEAAKEIARQLRLRDIGGIILVDFINMKETKDQQKVKTTLINALKNDRSNTSVFQFTATGLLELTRKKVRQSLLETLTENCHVCNGLGRSKTIETTVYEMERELLEYKGMDESSLWLEVSDTMDKLLNNELQDFFIHLKKQLPYQLFMTTRAYTTDHYYAIRQIGTVEEIKCRIDNNTSI